MLALKSAAEVLELSGSMRQEFELFHAVAAFRRLAGSPDAGEVREDVRLAELVARVHELVRSDAVDKDPRGLSDMSWLCSRLVLLNMALAGASAAWVCLRSSQLDPQGCVNAVWTPCKPNLSGHLLLHHFTLVERVRALDFSFQWLVRTSWACAKIRLSALPLLHALSEEVRNRISEFAEYEPQVLTNFL